MIIGVAISLFAICCTLYNSMDCADLYFKEIQSKESQGKDIKDSEQEQGKSEGKQRVRKTKATATVASSSEDSGDIESLDDFSAVLSGSDPVSKE